MVWACSHAGPERQRLMDLLEEGAPIAMSAWAWYELLRGPRTPEQLAVASLVLGDSGIVPVSGAIAEDAAEVFRWLGSPKRRAADIVIGVTARNLGATLLSRNADDFADIEGLEVEPLGS